jgi:6-phosphofructokinase 1
MLLSVLWSSRQLSGKLAAGWRLYPCLCLNRGCETYIVREGYEGLIRGNIEAEGHQDGAGTQTPPHIEDQGVEANLRFGYGALLRDWEGDSLDMPTERNLKGRYIVRVGWDDVRGWMGEVLLFGWSLAIVLSLKIINRVAQSSGLLAAQDSVQSKAG